MKFNPDKMNVIEISDQNKMIKMNNVVKYYLLFISHVTIIQNFRGLFKRI